MKSYNIGFWNMKSDLSRRGDEGDNATPVDTLMNRNDICNGLDSCIFMVDMQATPKFEHTPAGIYPHPFIGG